MAMVSGVLDFFQEQLRRLVAQFIFGLPNGRQRRRQDTGEIDIIIPDHRYILGHTDTLFGQAAHQAQGQQIVGTEDSGGTLLAGKEQIDAGLAFCGILTRRCDVENRCLRVQAKTLDRAPDAALALGSLPDSWRTMQKAEAAMALREEMACRQVSAQRIIYGDRAKIRRAAGMVQKDALDAMTTRALHGGFTADRGDSRP